MTERGTYNVDRGFWEHPAFADEPFTEREAWQWLISQAAFKAHRRRIGNFQLELKRGEVAASIRFLAERFKWHRSKCERFLHKLKTETMVRTRTETGVTVISICNYDKYQSQPRATETPSETPSETRPRQVRDKGEERNNDVIKASPNGEAPKTAQEAITATLWQHGPPILGKLGVKESQARKLIGKWLADKHTPEAIMRAIEQAERNGTREPFAFITAILKPKEKGWRRNGSGFYVKAGSGPFDAWWREMKRQNSPRQFEFEAAAEKGGEVRVSSLWPARGPP